MAEGTQFQPVLDDPIVDAAQVKRIVFLSGKLYYDLVKEREARGLQDDVAFIRFEELSPFPFHELEELLKAKYNSGKGLELVWLQEEPRNQGAWTHVSSRFGDVLERLDVQKNLKYVGRKESALPAPGVGKLYTAQQKAVIDGAFSGL